MSASFRLSTPITPLMNGMMKQNFAYIQTLKSSGVDFNIRDAESGELPIFHAIHFFPDSVAILLSGDKKPNLNVHSVRGDTPLTAAVRLNHIGLIKQFIANNANPYHADRHGKIALDYAVTLGSHELIKMLLTHMGFQSEASELRSLHGEALRHAVQSILRQGPPPFASVLTERGRIQHKLHQRTELEKTLSSEESVLYQQNKTRIKAELTSLKRNALKHFSRHTSKHALDIDLLEKALKNASPKSGILLQLRRFFICDVLWEGSDDNILRLVKNILPKNTLQIPSVMQLALLDFELYSLTALSAEVVSEFDHYKPKSSKSNVNSKNIHGYTRLMVAIQESDRALIATELANPKLEINTQEKFSGLTALFAAIEINDPEIVRDILTTQRGKVDFYLTNSKRQSVLDLAIVQVLHSDNIPAALQIFSLLLTEGNLYFSADHMIAAPETLFTQIAKHGDATLMQQAFIRCRSPQLPLHPNQANQTPLSIAEAKGDHTMKVLLSSHGMGPVYASKAAVLDLTQGDGEGDDFDFTQFMAPPDHPASFAGIEAYLSIAAGTAPTMEEFCELLATPEPVTANALTFTFDTPPSPSFASDGPPAKLPKLGMPMSTQANPVLYNTFGHEQPDSAYTDAHEGYDLMSTARPQHK